MKNKRLLISLLSVLFVSGCAVAGKSFAEQISNDIPTYVIDDKDRTIPPYTPSGDTDYKEITSVEIVGVPDNKEINIGYFDTYDIGYKIHYSDDTASEKVTLHFDDLVVPLKEIMSVPGLHKVALQLKGVKTIFEFNNIDTGLRYNATFKNYNDSTLYSYQIMPYAHPVYEGETPRRPRSGMVKFNFKGWDYDLPTVYVKGDMNFVAQYEMVPENNDFVGVTGNQIWVDDLSLDESSATVHMTGNYSLYYVGRMNNVPVVRDRLDPVHHTKGESEQMSIGFDETDKPKYAYELYQRINDSLNTAYSYNLDGLDPDISEDHYRYINCTNIPGTKFFSDFTVNPMEVTNILGETYTTTANYLDDYVDNMFENEDLNPDIEIPAELETGTYCPTIYLDIDLYLYVSLNVYSNGSIGYRAINAIPSPFGFRVDLGLDEDLPSKTTSTDPEDFMNIAVGQMFEHCKNIGNE